MAGFCTVPDCYLPAHGNAGLCRGHLRRHARGRPVEGPLRESGTTWSSLVEAAIGFVECSDCDGEYRKRALALRRAARAYASGTVGSDEG